MALLISALVGSCGFVMACGVFVLGSGCANATDDIAKAATEKRKVRSIIIAFRAITLCLHSKVKMNRSQTKINARVEIRVGNQGGKEKNLKYVASQLFSPAPRFFKLTHYEHLVM